MTAPSSVTISPSALFTGSVALARIGLDELHVIAVGHETQFHAFGLFRDRQIHFARQRRALLPW